jgi:hypothetical protein
MKLQKEIDPFRTIPANLATTELTLPAQKQKAAPKRDCRFQRLSEWSILGVATAISGKRQEMDSAIARPTPTSQETQKCI